MGLGSPVPSSTPPLHRKTHVSPEEISQDCRDSSPSLHALGIDRRGIRSITPPPITKTAQDSSFEPTVLPARAIEPIFPPRPLQTEVSAHDNIKEGGVLRRDLAKSNDLFVTEARQLPRNGESQKSQHSKLAVQDPPRGIELRKAKAKPPPFLPKSKELTIPLRHHRPVRMHKGLQLPEDNNEQAKDDIYQRIEGAQRVEDMGGAAMLSADNFPTLVAHFKMSSVYARFTPNQIDQGRALLYDAVSLKRNEVTNIFEAVWRRVALEADIVTSNVRLFDVDKKVFLVTRMDLDKAPSVRPDTIRHFQGLALGKGRPTVDQWEHFLSLWVEGREVPITILGKNSQDIQDLCRVLALVQAYKLRCREEARWAQTAYGLILMEMDEYPVIEVRDDFDSKYNE